MNSLKEACLGCIKKNINIIMKSPSESNKLLHLEEELLTKLADKLSNKEIDKVIEIQMEEFEKIEGDKEVYTEWKDLLQSILHCNLINSLTFTNPETHRGHYSSLNNVYKCVDCKKLIPPSISGKIQCIKNEITLDRKGEVRYVHKMEIDWNITRYVDVMRNQLEYSWREIYWKIWSECHYLHCVQCNLHYSLNEYDECVFHPGDLCFPSLDEREDVNKCSIIGQYTCCGAKEYLYNCTRLSNTGCQTKQHDPSSCNDSNVTDIVNIFNSHKDLILKLRYKINKSELKTENKSGNYNVLNSHLQPVNRSMFKRELLKKFSDKINAKIAMPGHRRYELNSTNFSQECYNSHCERATFTSDKNENLMQHKSYSHPCKKQRTPKPAILTINSEKLRKNEYEKLIMSMEASPYLKQNNNNKINRDWNKNFIQDEMHLCEEGCCLPLKEVNTDEKFFNKPIQYMKKAYRHKKMRCGLQSNRWFNKFSTRYNQDKQRENESHKSISISRWLTERQDSINALSNKDIVNNYLCTNDIISSSVDINSCTKDDITGDRPVSETSCSSIDSLTSVNSLSSYCSSLNSTVRIHHSRTTNIWNSFTPLAGNFVRIETEWRDESHNDPCLSDNNTDDDGYNINDNRKVNKGATVTRFHTRLKVRCKYPYYKTIQTQLHNRQHSFKYKNQNTNPLSKQKTIEIPLATYAEDYNRIWYYNRNSQELDYLSSTYMPILNHKQYPFMNSDLQTEWQEMFSLEKAWSAFLKLFSENESLPKNSVDGHMQQNIKLYHNLYNIYIKIDSRNETNSTKKVLEIIKKSGNSNNINN